ncbi:MAG TPA: hypothetical protein P5186_23300 [Candidatus Paceibacterota bacterium]|nr:hypothetical protein [Verrucomicrobiota bacterium]HRY50985.1 hypothetical protein [Candidatus Paceibacterota bacterium]
MNTAILAIFWELVWKNRVIFPALLLLLFMGGGLASALSHAAPDAWWIGQARGATLAAFLASLLLGMAPFTLMENQAGWRMNSMVTRWFVLPVRTLFLVGVPLGFAWGMVSLLLVVWSLVLHRAFGGVDMACFTLVFLVGITAIQMLAWSIPRKPTPFWVMVAFLFLSSLLTSVMLQESHDWQARRTTTLWALGALLPVMGFGCWWAAGRNRCGDWTGEIPFIGILDFLRRPWLFRHRGYSPTAALFWNDVFPAVRTFIASWIGLVLLVGGWACVSFWLRRPDLKINWIMIGRGLLEAMPFFGILWLMVWGLLMGGEPGMGFVTRLSAFRATRPVSVGLLAGMRLAPFWLSWLCLWLPLVLLHHCLLHDYQGLPARMGEELNRSAAALMAARMAFSANVMVGALPLLLRGRFDGFPNLFLATLVAWIWTWVLARFANQETPPDWGGWLLGCLLVFKVGTAIAMSVVSCRQGLINWRFPAVLFGGWLLTTGSLIGFLPVVPVGGWIQACGVAVLMPLARLAACPLAMAANRYR